MSSPIAVPDGNHCLHNLKTDTTQTQHNTDKTKLKFDRNSVNERERLLAIDIDLPIHTEFITIAN